MTDNKLPSHSFPGGYPLIYLDKSNDVFCADCATENDAAEPQIFFEGIPEYCGGCRMEIESAYGEPGPDGPPGSRA